MPTRPTPILALFFVLVVAVVFTTPALAEGRGKQGKGTPDGQTPAEETLCDPLKSATAGLYGLCVAYCEAQDCDFAGFVSGQCDAPNPKILKNYRKRMRPGDPDMPCVAPQGECPCFVHPDGRDVIEDARAVFSRFDESTSFLMCGAGEGGLWELAAGVPGTPGMTIDYVGLGLWVTGDERGCGYDRIDSIELDAGIPEAYSNVSSSLTSAQAATCQEQISALQSELGLCQ